MDVARFDHLTRTISTLLSRRTLAGALGLGALSLADMIDAKKKKRKKKKKIKKNQFGCVNVGGFCKNSGQCCSGICEGKKGKKKCKAHDQTTCQAGEKQEFCGGVSNECTTSAGAEGVCDTTTGDAGYCSAAGNGVCVDCTKDADCTALCGSQAACILCAGCEETITACVGQELDSCPVVMV